MRHTEFNEAEPTPAPLVPGACVRVSAEHAPVGPPRYAHAAEPRVELLREGDVVRAIDVTCGCGRRIRLRCVYPGQV